MLKCSSAAFSYATRLTFPKSALGPEGDIVFVDQVDFNVLRDSGSGNLTEVPVFFGACGGPGLYIVMGGSN